MVRRLVVVEGKPRDPGSAGVLADHEWPPGRKSLITAISHIFCAVRTATPSSAIPHARTNTTTSHYSYVYR